MKWLNLLAGLVVLFAFYNLASASQGITPELIQQIQKENAPDSVTLRLIDAVSKNGIQNVALNQAIIRQHDPYFSHEIKTAKITNQEQSGRCWLFGGLNVLRPYILKKLNIDDFEFSQAYLFFWDKLEKSNTFLEEVIKRRNMDIRDEDFQRILEKPLADGGWWNYFVYLVKKYGLVPKSVMPETESTKNSETMDRLLEQKLMDYAFQIRQMNQEGKTLDDMEKTKEKYLSEIYHMLCFHFGAPPEKFAFRYKPKSTEEDKDKKDKEKKDKEKKEDKEKSTLTEFVTYTPQEFAGKFVTENLDKYVVLANIPSRDYNQMYSLENARNIYDIEDFKFLNVRLEDLKKATLNSVLGDEPVWFVSDVSHEIDFTSGIMHPQIYLYKDIYGIDIKLPKERSILYRNVTTNHVMVFIGVDVVDGKPTKWLVENSWGEKVGKDGYLHMYDLWFDEYVIVSVVKLEYVPENIKPFLDTKPIIIKEKDTLGEFLKMR
jgi:bleomycin hydrolase